MNLREKLLQKAARLGLHDLPIGAYVTDREGKIVEANRYVRELLRLPLEGEPDASVGDFYPDPAVREKLSQTLDDAGERARCPSPTHSINVAGRAVHLRDHSCPIRDEETGEVIGYLSCVENVTHEHSLQERVEELTYDIGQMLHTYSSTLVMFVNAAASILRGLKPDPFADGRFVSGEAAADALAEPADRCATALADLFRLAGDDVRRTQAVHAGRLEDLRRIAEMLGDYKSAVPYPEIIPAALQGAALELLEILPEVGRGAFPKDLLRRVEAHARELVRIHSLITLHNITDAAVEMEHTVLALREFVVSDRRVEPPRSVIGASALMARAVDNIKEFARAKGVQLKRRAEDGGASVEVDERDVIRALENILHNAIKYSWSRASGGGGTWVQIHTYVEGGRLCFRVENYGVPITKDETEQGLIFAMGFRGRMSGDRGRVGSGIGLADAMRVAHEHGGDISIESRPAVAGRADDDYTQPFLTAVTFSLPVLGRGGYEGTQSEA